MTGSRRFSQAISEGDGISVIVAVADGQQARAAEAEGAEGIVLDRDVAGVRDATSLPILWRAPGRPQAAWSAGADACLLDVERLGDEERRLEESHTEALEFGLDCVVAVHDEEQLELALERVDPEIFLLAGGASGEEEPLDRVLDLLPDVPAGKLVIADASVQTRDEVVALERAGMDAVVVRFGNVAELVGGSPLEL